MKIAIVTVEIRTGHSPKESKSLPFKLTFWRFVFMQHMNERIAHVHKFSLGVCVHDTWNE